MLTSVLWSASVQGGLVAAIVLLITRAYPTMRPNTRVWMWRLVYLKFALALLPIRPLTLKVLPPITPALPVEASHGRMVTGSLVAVSSAKLDRPDAERSVPTDYIDWAASAWLCIAGILAGRAGLQTVKVRRIVTRSQPVTDIRLIAEFRRLVELAGLPRPPRLRSSELAPVPMVIWGLHCSVILPAAMMESEAREDLPLMLAHELAHLARKDLGWDIWSSLIHTIFFFHPLVWIARLESYAARECAADELALSFSRAPVKTYADMLFRTSLHCCQPIE